MEECTAAIFNKMKAIQLAANNSVEIVEVPKPEQASAQHVIIKMQAWGINQGDNALINGVFPKGSFPASHHDLAGVSGVGKIIQAGEGVPESYIGKNVTVYRSLKFDDNIIGTWSEYTHLHYLQCVIVDDKLNLEEYAGSLVNIITPYAFFKQITEEGHKGIISTASTSATGRALLGISLAYNFPLISIARNEESKKELEELGAKHIILQTDREQLAAKAQELQATAVFDGVGGSILNNIIDILPFGTTIYAYGWLGGQPPLSFHTSLLMKGLTIRGFNNYRTATIQNPQLLQEALNDISRLLGTPHFKTKIGKKFSFDNIHEALKFSDGGKAVFTLE
jgi:NADPH:quinone reductase